MDRVAKEKKLRLWKDYNPSAGPALDVKDKNFQAKVPLIILVFHAYNKILRNSK